MLIMSVVAKACVIAFFGMIFIGNLIGLMREKSMNFELQIIKQLWMLLSLLAISIVMYQI